MPDKEMHARLLVKATYRPLSTSCSLQEINFWRHFTEIGLLSMLRARMHHHTLLICKSKAQFKLLWIAFLMGCHSLYSVLNCYHWLFDDTERLELCKWFSWLPLLLELILILVCLRLLNCLPNTKRSLYWLIDSPNLLTWHATCSFPPQKGESKFSQSTKYLTALTKHLMCPTEAMSGPTVGWVDTLILPCKQS